ncbi:MAG: rod shape-determining protein MreC [Campylobacterota bacterium]|nr:rod shape-determining protein MreC [Campylobacterota bacterium]
MKTRILVIILLLLFLTIVVTRKDDRIVGMLLSIVNPIKQTYTNVTREVEDKSQSYIYQKEHIQKLAKENKFLRKRLLEQKHYVQQVKDLYSKIPSLERVPRKSIEIVQTISYVKLNSFSQIILTKPQDLKDDSKQLFGLIQGDVAAGVAEIYNENLYGSLTSNEKCRFSVFVGEKRSPGIAMGVSINEMYVKFIPKWSDIKAGDEVVTSGLDSIFFANVPVGVVEKVEVESSYKVAYIKTYADVLHPDYFYLITDPSVTLASKFDGNITVACKTSASKSDGNITSDSNVTTDSNITAVLDGNETLGSMQDPNISSIPSILPEEPKDIIQTSEEEVDPEKLEIPVEETVQPKPKKKKKKMRPRVDDLNMF